MIVQTGCGHRKTLVDRLVRLFPISFSTFWGVTFHVVAPCCHVFGIFLLSFDICTLADQLREQFLFSKSTLVCNVAHILGMVLLLPVIFKSSTYNEKNNCFLRWKKRHFPPANFSHPSSSRFVFQILSPTRIQLDRPGLFFANTTLPLSCWCLFSNSEFVRWHKTTNVAKWTVLPSNFARRMLYCSLLIRPKPVVSAMFPTPCRQPPLRQECSLLLVWESVCAPCCSATWKHDLGPRGDIYESFLYSMWFESSTIRWLCPHDLSMHVKSSVFSFPFWTIHLRTVDPSLNRSGLLVW